jgi:phenylalanine ammonia-lyase
MKTLRVLASLINNDVIPVVGMYGGLGASGDLAQNGRVLSTLLQNPYTKVWIDSKENGSARRILKKRGIKPLTLDPKEGLALVNGDNFSTAACAMIAHEIGYLMLLNTLTSSLMIQVLEGRVRDYHPVLAKLKPHPGQAFEANLIRELLLGSKLAAQDLEGHRYENDGSSVQDPYSIRCLPQYYGSSWEFLAYSWKQIEINANSVSDNPVWVTPEFSEKNEKAYQWVSGGNFLAMPMSETIDGLRKIVIKIVKQNDRHLARLINPSQNKGLPPNLSDDKSISKCVFKGLQTQMGMYEVYASLLANPVSTAFGVHEENNQDITSHAFTSAILTWDVIKIAKYSIATNLISACQAVDLKGGASNLSTQTKKVYRWVRNIIPYIKKEQPLGHFVEEIMDDLNENYLSGLIIDYAKKIYRQRE